MQSPARKCDTQRRRAESTEHHTRPPTDDGSSLEGGGALQRFLTSVLAGILTLVFAWRILLGAEESEDGAWSVTKSTTDGDGDQRYGGEVSWSIDRTSVGGGGGGGVDHGNADAGRVPGERFTLPGNWIPCSTPGRADMPSRNCADDTCSREVRCIDEQSESSCSSRNKSPVVVKPRRVESPTTTATGEDRRDGNVRLYGRRQLVWATAASATAGSDDDDDDEMNVDEMDYDEDESGSDDESSSPCSSDDVNFFHALMAQQNDDERCHSDDDDDDDDVSPEVTSSTWISLFRTFFVSAAGQQRARPTTRRLQDRDSDDLLDRTLSTISEESVDELARRLSEMDDDPDMMTTAWRSRDTEEETSGSWYYDTGHDEISYSSSDEDVDYVSSIRCQSADYGLRYIGALCAVLVL